MVTINEQIGKAWEDLLINKGSSSTNNKQVQHSLHEMAFIISQLIMPTLTIIVQLATLYYTKKDHDNTNSFKQIDDKKSEIKEILENYNVVIENIEDVDGMIKTIITKIQDK